MNQNFKDTAEIKSLLEKYFNAVYQADIDTLKEIFLPQASMYGYLGENIVVGTPEIFYADLSSKNSMAKDNIDCKSVIQEINVTANTATAKLFVEGFFGFATVLDCFNLIKQENRWYICCKTFTTV